VFSTKREIASVFAAGASDVDTAVKAARKALHDPSWKKISATERGNLLLKLAELVEKNQEILATIDTWDNGMPVFTALVSLD
jgi:aldehyde dehydrogenase (NAD+)